jgi:hypothetical protein
MLKLPIKPNPVSALPEKYHKSTKYGGYTIGPPTKFPTLGPLRSIFRMRMGSH